MRNVREKAGTPVAEDFRDGGGTPIVVDTQNEVAYAINSAGSVFALSGAAGGGITNINVSAGTTSNNLSKLTFSNGGGVSFGLNGSVITATVATNYQSAGAYLTTAMQSNASSVFAGVGETTTTQAGTALGLTVNTAGVNIAYPAWLTTAQAPGAYLTTARASNDGIGLNTAATQVTWTVDSGGISLNAGAYLTTAQPPGAYLTTAMLSDASTAFAGIGESTGTTAGTDLKMTVDTAGVNISFPKWITTAAASDHSHGNPTLALTNLTGTTASASNGFTLSLSAAAPGAGGGIAAAAGTQTGTSGTVAFVDSNGITFGMSGSTRITASHNGLTTARASNDAVGLGTALTAGPLAWTVNSGGISLNAGSAAGTSTGFTGANISASITHNTAGIAISASVAAPGGGAANSASWHRINELVTTAALWNNATFSNRPMFVPFKMQEAITAVNSVNIYVSRTGGTSAAATLHWGVYTLANATSMNLISSTSFNISLTTSAQFSGIRRLQFTGLGALSLSPGQYVMGLLASQAGTASWGMNAMGIGSAAIVGVIHPGTNSTAATATNTLAEPFMGVWNANSAALPSAVAASSVRGGLGGNNARVYALIKAIT